MSFSLVDKDQDRPLNRILKIVIRLEFVKCEF